MTQWKHKLDIKQYITHEGTSWDACIKCANGIAKELRKLPQKYFDDNWNFADDVEFLESVGMEDSNFLDSPEDLENEINYRLESIYDFADYHKIWLG